MSQWDSSNFSLSHTESHHRDCYLLTYVGMESIHPLAVRLGLFSNPKKAVYGGCSGEVPAESSFKYGMVVGVG
jgi:hypothetical protein